MVAACTSATREEERSVAEAYLGSVSAQDWSAMHGWLAPDARYQDFTMEHLGVDRIDLQDADAIVDFWRGSSESSGTSTFGWDWTERWVSGPHVVFLGTGHVDAAGAAWDLPVEMLKTRFSQVTHLCVVDGRVIYHADHVDYAAAEADIVEQVEVHNRAYATDAVYVSSPVRDGLSEKANQYLSAVHHADWEAVESWLGHTSSYLTASADAAEAGPTERARGVAAIVEHLRGVAAQSPHQSEFETECLFVAGAHVIARVQTTGFGGGDGERRSSNIVHLTFEGDTVVRHAEF